MKQEMRNKPKLGSTGSKWKKPETRKMKLQLPQ